MKSNENSMKSLFLTGVAVLSASCLFAQKKIDLAVMAITSPGPSAVLTHGDARAVKFTLKNNGPDAIAPTDTIYYKLKYTGSPYNFRFIQGQNIAVGGSQTFDLGNLGNWANTTMADISDTFCVVLFPQSSVTQGSRQVTVTYSDTIGNNNANCNFVKIKRQTIGIFELNDNTVKETLNLYPNPSDGLVTFNVELEKQATVTAVVTDLTGRKIMEKDFGKVRSGTPQTLTLDIAELTPGMYLIEVLMGDKKAIGRVSKRD